MHEMNNYNRDGWTDRAWEELEKAREALFWAGMEIDGCIGSGGGSFGPEQLDEMISAAENALRRMKAVRNSYE